jgi:hypothetical protein
LPRRRRQLQRKSFEHFPTEASKGADLHIEIGVAQPLRNSDACRTIRMTLAGSQLPMPR